MAWMSSHDNEIDMLATGQLEEIAFGMSPSRFDRDRDFVAQQDHLDSFSQIALDENLDFLRIFR